MRIELYGFLADGDIDVQVASQLREVTLVANPTTLRFLACFLEHTASLIEDYGPNFNHEHLADFAKDVGKDISNDPAFVVMAPFVVD
jgi:hypothetical protein